MAKKRIHELAAEINQSSKDIVAFLKEQGIEKKSSSSGLDAEQEKLIRDHYNAVEEDEAPLFDLNGTLLQDTKPEPEPEVKTPDKNADSASGTATGAAEGKNAGEKAGEQPESNTAAADKEKDKKADKTSDKTSDKAADKAAEKKKSIVFVENKAEKKSEKNRDRNRGGKKDNKDNKEVQQPKPADIMALFNKSLGIKEEKKPAPAVHVEEKPVKEEAPRKVFEPEIESSAIALKNQIKNIEASRAKAKEEEAKRPKASRDDYDDRGSRKNDKGDKGEKNNRKKDDRRQNNGKGKDQDKKAGISFAGSSTSNRNSDNRFANQGRNGKPGDRSQANVANAPLGSKEVSRKSKKKDDRRRDFDMEEEKLKSKKVNPHGFHKPEKVVVEEEKIKVITLPEKLTVKELADKMKIQPAVIIKKLFLQGQMVTVNNELTYEEAENIAIEYEIICEKEEKIDVIAELLKEDDEDEKKMVKRPPVVCVMGHVDHGKTSLLDAIRKTNVTDREAGGITQHIGAYMVNSNGNSITFLDTPGHEAFTAMRMRGANSTDIAILVVAADDGVMPQTVEAINHAKAAGIEIIVAVNKIDKPNANIDRVKQELSEHELIPEDWGGSTVFAPVSAKTGEGIAELLEMVLLTADILELKANPKRQARGLVIEAELDKGRGPVARILVQKGTLHVGDFIAAGACHGKVRAMIDDKGRKIKEATPSTPVEILGLNDVPNAGEVFISPDSDKDAKNFAQTFIAQNKERLLDDTKQRMSLDELFTQIKEGNLKELNLIVKADVQGSVEAVKTSLLKLSNEEVIVKVIHSGVGAINESDVILASASNAIIIGFNVRPDATAKNTADTEGVDVRLYNVIYQAIEDVEAAMKGMLDPVYEEKIIGHAEVRQIFKASGIGNIAGSYVLDGAFERGCKVRITREGEQIFEGDLASLKRFKDDVKEVKAGFECGLVFDGFGDMKEFDVIEAYKMVEVPR